MQSIADHAAPQSRDRYECCLRYDPGSAAHRYGLRCVRGTGTVLTKCGLLAILAVLRVGRVG
jgi:hypothetical protein